MAIAPDALTPLGGYPGDEDRARAMFAQLDRDKARDDMQAAGRWLQARADSNGKLGAVGFCWGGGITHALATRMPELAAAVPFYGPSAAPADAPKVKAALLVQLAENDEGVNSTWPPYEAALKQAGVRYTAHVYPGTVHAFNNDTTPRYHAQAAKLAWSRTVDFFKERLA
jgi:carboxymethylenebutenolidase